VTSQPAEHNLVDSHVLCGIVFNETTGSLYEFTLDLGYSLLHTRQERSCLLRTARAPKGFTQLQPDHSIASQRKIFDAVRNTWNNVSASLEGNTTYPNKI
jgi:hypothetical protein